MTLDRRIRDLVLAALGLLCMAAPASAATRAVGDQFTYTLKGTITPRCPPVCRPSQWVNFKRKEQWPTAP